MLNNSTAESGAAPRATATGSHTEATLASTPEGVPGEVCYRAWSPDHGLIEVEINPADGGPSRLLRMRQTAGGYHEVCDPEGREGDKYRFRIHGRALPDPGSHAQAEGVHSWSLVVDHRRYQWGDGTWQRPPFRDLAIYELHVGTFTPEGTFRAAIDKLPHLQALGITAIELMPIAEVPGERNWGYDGVLIYAPAHAYGSPDDLRALVDAAHQRGIAVILDVVYNHFGPDGNYLQEYCQAYFNMERQTPWGPSLNFDGAQSLGVRTFFLTNPVYWMENYHIDGFRLDATHAITDSSERHILQQITEAVHTRGGYVIAEDERNDARLITPAPEGGLGFDAVWADDFHHVARVGQTRETDGYYANYQGTNEELAETLMHGWLYRGQRAMADGQKRGTECANVTPTGFVHCISNHDQIGNRAFGERLSESISPEAYRALSVLLCLTPYTPMLFMGQEWAASTPFLYFTDHNEELGRLVTMGRQREFAGFAAFGNTESLGSIPDPQAEESFVRSKLNWTEVAAGPHARVLGLYRHCLELRKSESAFRPQTRDSWSVARFASDVLGLRYEGAETSYLLLVDTSGTHSGNLPGEALAEPADQPWEVYLSSNETRFGGSGSSSFDPGSQQYTFTAPEALLLRRPIRS